MNRDRQTGLSLVTGESVQDGIDGIHAWVLRIMGVGGVHVTMLKIAMAVFY